MSASIEKLLIEWTFTTVVQVSGFAAVSLLGAVPGSVLC
jgi:hypothetical protein